MNEGELKGVVARELVVDAAAVVDAAVVAIGTAPNKAGPRSDTDAIGIRSDPTASVERSSEIVVPLIVMADPPTMTSVLDIASPLVLAVNVWPSIMKTEGSGADCWDIVPVIGPGLTGAANA